MKWKKPTKKTYLIDYVSVTDFSRTKTVSELGLWDFGDVCLNLPSILLRSYTIGNNHNTLIYDRMIFKAQNKKIIHLKIRDLRHKKKAQTP